MDVREKLALTVCKATQKTNYKCEFNCEKKGKCAYCLVMAEQMVANGVTVQEWISVEDRLPDSSGYYLTYRTGYCYVLSYSTKNKLFNSYDEDNSEWAKQYHVAVTHWMPLPQVPKGE